MLQKLKLHLFIIKWTICFLNNRSINLAFNKQKQDLKQIYREISQELSILSILSLLYIRFLFLKLEIKFKLVKNLSFIDDLVIYVFEKIAKEYYTILTEAV